MKHLFKPILVSICVTVLTSLSMSSQAQEKMVIALKTSDFELTETDISSLATGESKTIETESGKVIDILKTGDGVEIYVDGELLEVKHPQEGHMIESHIEIICDDEENCDEDIVVIADHDTEISDWVTDKGENVVILKEIVHACSGDESTSCSGQNIRVDGKGDFDIEELHEGEDHQGEGRHKIIVIKKDVLAED